MNSKRNPVGPQWFLALMLTFVVLAVPVRAQDVDAAEGAAPLSDAELQQMLAPIALYPDTVLAHILIAATYPLEVVQAQRWVENNPDLAGDAALTAVENEDWDPSVKALVPFPQVLSNMNSDLDWTQDIGEAFLADEARVMDAIQSLRRQAYDEGNLEGLDRVQVTREKETIIIEPVEREVVYIPYYDSRYVYGRWLWYDYPPVYWGYAGYPYYGPSSFFYWSPGVHLSFGFHFSSFAWHHRHAVVVDHHYYPRYYSHYGHEVAHHQHARHWQHNSHHRRGVVYRNPRTRDYFEKNGVAKGGFDNNKSGNNRREQYGSHNNGGNRNDNHRSGNYKDTGKSGVDKASSSRNYARTQSSQRQWGDEQRKNFSSRMRSNSLNSDSGNNTGHNSNSHNNNSHNSNSHNNGGVKQQYKNTRDISQDDGKRHNSWSRSGRNYGADNHSGNGDGKNNGKGEGKGESKGEGKDQQRNTVSNGRNNNYHQGNNNHQGEGNDNRKNNDSKKKSSQHSGSVTRSTSNADGQRGSENERFGQSQKKHQTDGLNRSTSQPRFAASTAPVERSNQGSSDNNYRSITQNRSSNQESNSNSNSRSQRGSETQRSQSATTSSRATAPSRNSYGHDSARGSSSQRSSGARSQSGSGSGMNRSAWK